MSNLQPHEKLREESKFNADMCDSRDDREDEAYYMRVVGACNTIDDQITRIATLERELSEAKEREARLRQLLFLRVAGASGYSDDGELQDSTTFPVIDFKHDTIQAIEDKLIERGVANFVKTFGAALQEKNNG